LRALRRPDAAGATAAGCRSPGRSPARPLLPVRSPGSRPSRAARQIPPWDRPGGRDRAVAAAVPAAWCQAIWEGLWREDLLHDRRQFQGHGGAAARLGDDPDLAVMEFDQRLGDGEAEADAVLPLRG